MNSVKTSLIAIVALIFCTTSGVAKDNCSTKMENIYLTKELTGLSKKVGDLRGELRGKERALDNIKDPKKKKSHYGWSWESDYSDDDEDDDEYASIKSLTEPEKEALIKKYQTEIESLKREVEVASSFLSHVVAKNRQQLLNLIHQDIKDPNQATLLNEYALDLNIMKSLRKDKTVTLTLGSTERNPTPEEQKQFSDLTAELVGRGYNIIYDADSKAADLIGQIAGKQGIGVSRDQEKTSSNPGLILKIKNPYLRFSTFNISGEKISSPDSIVGMALAINNNAPNILDVHNNFKNSLKSWASDLSFSENLGLKYEKLFSVDSGTKLANAIYKSEKGQKPVFPKVENSELPADPLLPNFHTLSLEDLLNLLNYRDAMIEGRTAFVGIKGAVVFGSGKLVKNQSPEIYKLAYLLGSENIPVFTGGAGGAMLAANMGAFDAGGKSIGVPMGRGAELDSEKKISTEIQTATVVSSGYGSRIPLLLENRNLVIIVPGGSGTMREVAVAMIKLESEKNSKAQIIFFDSYYKNLEPFFHSGNLPERLVSRIHFVRNTHEFNQLLRTLVSSGKLEISDLQEPGKVSPRSDRNALPYKEIKEKSDD